MNQYFIFYATSNAVGIIVFAIMLIHDRMSIDRQEKQLKYDHALITFMLYFLSDSLWAGVDSGVFPVNTFTAIATDFSNYVIMTATTYAWLRFVMAYLQAPNRNKPITRFAIIFPFLISTVALIVTYIVAPGVLLDENYKATVPFFIYLVGVPYIYIIAVVVYTVKKAIHEENPVEKRRWLYVGIIPLAVIGGGIVQMVALPELPTYCFACTIVMLVFYIQSMDSQISTDPLTGLNNRGHLTHYVSQTSNLYMEGRSTYVVMIDVNDFKSINDFHGHAEGDAALVIVAHALTESVGNCGMPVFIGRYGGDEFVLVANPVKEEELKELIASIRAQIAKKCAEAAKPYVITIGAGYDELLREHDTFQQCLQRADTKLYLDKEYGKIAEKAKTAK